MGKKDCEDSLPSRDDCKRGGSNLRLNQFSRKWYVYIYNLILCQFQFWEYYFQASMRVKIAKFSYSGTGLQTHQMSLDQITLVHLHLVLLPLFWISNMFIIIDQCRYFDSWDRPWYSDKCAQRLHYIRCLGSLRFL